MSTDFLAQLDLTDEQRARVQDLGDALQVTLLEPFTYKHSKLDGDRTVTELRLVKKVKGKHMKALDQVKGEMGQSLALLAVLAGLPVHATDELDALDMEVALAVVEPFLPKSRKTGTS